MEAVLLKHREEWETHDHDDKMDDRPCMVSRHLSNINYEPWNFELEYLSVPMHLPQSPFEFMEGLDWPRFPEDEGRKHGFNTGVDYAARKKRAGRP